MGCSLVGCILRPRPLLHIKLLGRATPGFKCPGSDTATLRFFFPSEQQSTLSSRACLRKIVRCSARLQAALPRSIYQHSRCLACLSMCFGWKCTAAISQPQCLDNTFSVRTYVHQRVRCSVPYLPKAVAVLPRSCHALTDSGGSPLKDCPCMLSSLFNSRLACKDFHLRRLRCNFPRAVVLTETPPEMVRLDFMVDVYIQQVTESSGSGKTTVVL